MGKWMLSVLLLVSLTAGAEPVVFRVGYFSLSPHSYQSQGEATGAVVGYLEQLAVPDEVRLEWVGPLPFPRMMEYLKQGRLDAALMLSKGQQRERYLYFPDHSFFSVRASLAVKADNPLSEVDGIDAIRGYRLGYLEGANLSEFVEQNQSELKMHYLGGKSWVTQNLKKVLKGRLDAAYDLNQTTLRYEAARLGVLSELKFLSLPDTPKPLYVAFSKFSPNGRLMYDHYRTRLDQGIADYQNFVEQEMLNAGK